MSEVIVIGAGFSGLAAACHLAKGGAKVHVLERHDQPGGRTRIWERDGYRFDLGPSWYWMPDLFERFFGEFGHQVDELCEPGEDRCPWRFHVPRLCCALARLASPRLGSVVPRAPRMALAAGGFWGALLAKRQAGDAVGVTRWVETTWPWSTSWPRDSDRETSFVLVGCLIHRLRRAVA